MDKRVYKTLLVDFASDDVKKGISGIADAIFGVKDKSKRWIHVLTPCKHRYVQILYRTASEEDYKIFKIIVEHYYPGLCQFDVDFKTKKEREES